MTNKEMYDFLIDSATKYYKISSSSISRNSHMNDLRGEYVTTDVVNAVLVDFINNIALDRGVDLALYTKDLI